ncbi:MAG: histone deacetylase [Actinomycetota bacterium]
MSAVVEYPPAGLGHDAGPGHPERPARLRAVVAGIEAAGLGADVEWVTPRAATVEEVALVHDPGHIEAVRRFSERGGGMLTLDTGAGPRSWDAALAAAGAVLDAGERQRAAFCAVRPPGHHATAGQAQGFCLFNNVAVGAAALAARGERVLVVDWDAHHGNGTQDLFYADDRVLYVSMHQWPLYPFTGGADETGTGPGAGHTVNFPLPPGATGDVYQAAMDVVGRVSARFEPTWALVSSGFDSHRDDILEDTALGLTSGDYAALTRRVAELVPPGRCVVVLEGGYDLDALANSSAAVVAALAGRHDFQPAEPATSGGPGLDAVATTTRLAPLA